jgi:RNA recognition motif-containing protein
MSARFGIDRITGKRRGFAYVEFATPEEVSDAFNKNANAKC